VQFSHNGYEWICSLYIRLTPGHLRLMESWGTLYTLENISKPPLSLVITSIGFITSFESVNARISSFRECESKVFYLVDWFLSEPHLYSVCRPFGAIVTRQQVFAPSVRCGAAPTFLCGGCGDPIHRGKAFYWKAESRRPGTWREPWWTSLSGMANWSIVAHHSNFA